MGLAWYAPIFVTNHAVERAQERLLYRVDRDEIRAEVRAALVCDRVSTSYPNWARGGWVKPPDPDDGRVYYVWDEDATRCWIVARARDGIHVRTLILGDDVRSGRSDVRSVRNGFRRVT